MSPIAALTALRKDGFPRVSGDEPDIAVIAIPYTEFSPRERG